MPSNRNTAHYVRSVCNELCRDVEGRQGGGCIYAVAVHHEVMTEFNPNPTHTHKHHFVSSSTWIWCHFHLLWCICIWLSETGRKNTAWCRCHTVQPARPHLEMVCLATHLLIQWFFFNANFIVVLFILRHQNYEGTHMDLCSKQNRIRFIFHVLQSSHLLLWWQLCTLLVFSQSDSWGGNSKYSNIFD